VNIIDDQHLTELPNLFVR